MRNFRNVPTRHLCNAGPGAAAHPQPWGRPAAPADDARPAPRQLPSARPAAAAPARHGRRPQRLGQREPQAVSPHAPHARREGVRARVPATRRFQRTRREVQVLTDAAASSRALIRKYASLNDVRTDPKLPDTQNHTRFREEARTQEQLPGRSHRDRTPPCAPKAPHTLQDECVPSRQSCRVCRQSCCADRRGKTSPQGRTERHRHTRSLCPEGTESQLRSDVRRNVWPRDHVRHSGGAAPSRGDGTRETDRGKVHETLWSLQTKCASGTSNTQICTSRLRRPCTRSAAPAGRRRRGAPARGPKRPRESRHMA